MPSKQKNEPHELRVLGIDPSLTATAVCAGPVFVPAAEPEYVVHVFNSKPGGTSIRGRVDRYAYLSDLVLQACDRYLPCVVVLEGYSHGSQGSSTLDLAEYGGFLRGQLCTSNADLYECAPSTLKKFATGVGKGSKVAVAGAITQRYGVRFDTDDEYDSYALARLAACIAQIDQPTNDPQREAIAKVLKGRVSRLRRSRLTNLTTIGG